MHVFAAPCRCRRCSCAQSAAAREPVNSTAATRAAQVRCVQLPPACGQLLPLPPPILRGIVLQQHPALIYNLPKRFCCRCCLCCCCLCCCCSCCHCAGLLSDPTAAASYELVFAAEMPPVGYATYALLSQHNATTTSSSASATADLLPGSAGGQPTASAAVGTEPIAAEARAPASHTQLSNGVLNLTLHAVTGRLVAVSAADGSWAMSFSQELMLYKSSTGDESNTAAAAGNTARQTAMQGNRSSGSRQGGTTGRQVQQGDCQVRAAAAGRAVRGVEVGCGGGDEGESDGGQSSGAYIFRPAGDSPVSRV